MHSQTCNTRLPSEQRQIGLLMHGISSKRFISFEHYYDRTGISPFNTRDRLIPMTTWPGLIVYEILPTLELVHQND